VRQEKLVRSSGWKSRPGTSTWCGWCSRNPASRRSGMRRRPASKRSS